jgi:chromate transporter
VTDRCEAEIENPAENAAIKPSLRELAQACFKIGCLGFGGPAGQIALMHRIFVAEKQWIDEERYLHALNYCMLLPGPEAQQLATYVGWLLQGVRGGVIAGALFVAPGALIVFGLSWLYALHAHTPVVSALFYGIKAAVLALVFEAMVRIGKRALQRPPDLMIAILAFCALYLFGAPFPIVIVAAGAFGFWRASSALAIARMPIVQPSTRGALSAAMVWAVIWVAPLAASFALLGRDHVLTHVGVLFSQLSVVTFGGAYAVLAYLQEQAVETQHWLSAGQMIDGLGLAETTPGPLILVNQYVGFLAGWQTEGGGFGMAVGAAAMASWCTFAPSYVWIFAGAPFAERIRQNRFAAGALGAVTAAVLGVIANLAIWFSLHVLFKRDAMAPMPWGRLLALPDILSFDPVAALIALAAGLALMRFRMNVVLVIVFCALAGFARLVLP